MIDFTTPCYPDIFSMDQNTRDAGEIIRKKIQDLYKEYLGLAKYDSHAITQSKKTELIRRENICTKMDNYKNPKNYGIICAAESRKMYTRTPSEEVAVAKKSYQDLYDAYHAWSNSAWRATPYKANASLLETAII